MVVWGYKQYSTKVLVIATHKHQRIPSSHHNARLSPQIQLHAAHRPIEELNGCSGTGREIRALRRDGTEDVPGRSEALRRSQRVRRAAGRKECKQRAGVGIEITDSSGN